MLCVLENLDHLIVNHVDGASVAFDMQAKPATHATGIAKSIFSLGLGYRLLLKLNTSGFEFSHDQTPHLIVAAIMLRKIGIR